MRYWIFGLISFCIIILFLEADSAIVPADRSKIIIFSHYFHADTVGVECDVCHTSVKESTQSSDNLLPKMDVCQTCHDGSTASDSCNVCHQDPDNAVAFENPKRDIKFNHKHHVENEKLECQKCHIGIDKVNYSIRAPHALPEMSTCMSCHDGVRASDQCEFCHTQVDKLRPLSHTPDWRRMHRTSVRSGDVSCQQCHDDTYCQQCHDLPNAVESHKKSTDHYAPFSPVISGKGSNILSKVHDLNYRYTHAIDARGKVQDCETCHETSTFCNKCHEYERSFMDQKPKWHSGPDWGALAGAVGSGGGMHARMAKKDIGQCAACHDEQGEDPTCLLCHRDIHPGKGNDPKTHDRNMADKIGTGYFHDNDDAICYNCHERSSAGIGFCGYCHGVKRD